LQDCATICSSLAIAWSDLKYGNGKDKYLAWNVVEVGVVSLGESMNVKAVGRCVGLKRRFLKRVMVCR
jgi:hypothetical protein